MRYNLTWHRAGHTVPLSWTGRVRLLPDSSSLQISGVRPQDAGEYHCVATNAHGNSRITVWLLVPGILHYCNSGEGEKNQTRRSSG